MEIPKISLKAARVNAGYDQRNAACRLNINRATLQNYEKGKTVPDWNMVLKMERLYNYPANYIYFGKD